MANWNVKDQVVFIKGMVGIRQRLPGKKFNLKIELESTSDGHRTATIAVEVCKANSLQAK